MDDLLSQLQELRELSHQLSEESRTLCEESRILRADAQRVRVTSNPWPYLPEAVRALPEEEAVPLPTNPHDAAMNALRQIRDLVDQFPHEWQVAILKALAARTLIKGHEHLQAASLTALSA